MPCLATTVPHLTTVHKYNANKKIHFPTYACIYNQILYAFQSKSYVGTDVYENFM